MDHDVEILFQEVAGLSPEHRADYFHKLRVAPHIRAEVEALLEIDSDQPRSLTRYPAARYRPVDAVAEDLGTVRDAPVAADLGQIWYRSRRFLRRYWALLAASALTLGGLTVSLYVANRQRAAAERRFEDVRDLAARLLDIDDQARQLPGSSPTRQAIVNATLEYWRRLAPDMARDPEFNLEAGTAYLRVARIEGVPLAPGLGQTDAAEQHLRTAEGLLQSVLASRPADRTALLRLAQVAHDRMMLAGLEGRHDQTLAFAQQSANWLERFQAGVGDQAEAASILNTYLNLANHFLTEERLDDALRLSRRGVALARSFGRPADLADLSWASAKVYRSRGDLDDALQAIQESVRLLEPSSEVTDSGQSRNFVLALILEGQILGEDDAVSLGRSGEGVKQLQRAFQIADSLVHRDSHDAESRERLAMAGIGMADILRRSDAQRALELYDHVLRHLAEIPDDPGMERLEVNALAGSSYPLRQFDRIGESRQRLDQAFRRLNRLKLYPADKVTLGSPADETLRAQAELEAYTGNLDGALQIYRRLRQLLDAGRPHPDTNLAEAVRLSALYHEEEQHSELAGHTDRASALHAQLLDLWRGWERKLPGNPFVLRRQMAALAR